MANPLSLRRLCDSNKSHFFRGLVLYCRCLASLFIFLVFNCSRCFFHALILYIKANIEFFIVVKRYWSACFFYSDAFIVLSSGFILFVRFVVIFAMWMHRFEQFLHSDFYCLSLRQHQSMKHNHFYRNACAGGKLILFILV